MGSLSVSNNHHDTVRLFLVAISVCVIGLLVYVFDRQPETVYFLPEWLSHQDASDRIFGGVGAWLPTFVHVYVFILLTVAVAPTTIKLVPVCLGWFVLECLFEFGQVGPVGEWIYIHTYDLFKGIPILENTGYYFQKGSFDVMDLFAIAAGTIAAYFTIIIIRKEYDHEYR
jgi:hypothetical protein